MNRFMMVSFTPTDMTWWMIRYPGGGTLVSGLACAALLAKAGKRVVVLESHYRAGGCTHTFSEVGDGGDAFDTGIHYVGMGATLRKLLSHVSAPGSPMRFAAMGTPAVGRCKLNPRGLTPLGFSA